MQSGYLDPELWGEGSVDTNIWFVAQNPPSLTSGEYDAEALTITATGSFFFAYKGSGDLYYRKDDGAWVAMPLYVSWASGEVVGQLIAVLEYGVYDLKIVRSDSEESVLDNAFYVLPEGQLEYWADFNAVAPGDGTEVSPWDLSQVKAYFSEDPGYFKSSNYLDILNVKGDIVCDDAITALFTINAQPLATGVIIKGWDKQTNGLWTISSTKSGMSIFKFNDIQYPFGYRVYVSDCAFLITDVDGASLDLTTIFDNTVQAGIHYNDARIQNSIITSENDFVISNECVADIDGCTISVKDCAIFFENNQSGYTAHYDNVINLSGTAAIIDESTDGIGFYKCEFNVTESVITQYHSNCIFENLLLENLFTSLDSTTFREKDFNFASFGIQTEGYTEWLWGPSGVAISKTDIVGETRLGIGAFIFAIGEYYVDGAKQIPGIGTFEDQLSLNQLRNYFDSSVGDACGISATGHDTFFIKGIFGIIDNFFLSINNDIGGTVTLKAQDIMVNKSWFIETKDSHGSEFNILDIGSSASISKLIIKDFILTQNTDTITDLITINSAGISGRMDIEIKNVMLYCKSAKIYFSTEDEKINLYGYGITAKTPDTFSALCNVTSSLLLSDSVISADLIYGELGLWNHVETNRAREDLSTTIINLCTFNSTVAVGLLPPTFDANDFKEMDFIYDMFGFLNEGSGE